jgi:uncharacterized membrane protein
VCRAHRNVLDLLSAQLPLPWLIATWSAAVALFGLIALHAAWFRLKNPADLNVFLGACVAVLMLWQIKAGIEPGLSLHLLGATALTLMLRPLFALLALAIVVGSAALWSGQYAAFAANWLLLGALPVTASWLTHRAVGRWLPPHLFVYLFLNAFAGAAIAMLVVGAGATLVSLGMGLYSVDHLLNDYLPVYLLMAWGEAFLTGMLVTLMVVWKPGWVATFSDERYLSPK